eukprot:366507-Chlamydomonas_euryale.AAC.3
MVWLPGLRLGWPDTFRGAAGSRQPDAHETAHDGLLCPCHSWATWMLRCPGWQPQRSPGQGVQSGSLSPTGLSAAQVSVPWALPGSQCCGRCGTKADGWGGPQSLHRQATCAALSSRAAPQGDPAAQLSQRHALLPSCRSATLCCPAVTAPRSAAQLTQRHALLPSCHSATPCCTTHCMAHARRVRRSGLPALAVAGLLYQGLYQGPVLGTLSVVRRQPAWDSGKYPPSLACCQGSAVGKDLLRQPQRRMCGLAAMSRASLHTPHPRATCMASGRLASAPLGPAAAAAAAVATADGGGRGSRGALHTQLWRHTAAPVWHPSARVHI